MAAWLPMALLASYGRTLVPIVTWNDASTGPVLGRCWQHRPSTGPVLANERRIALQRVRRRARARKPNEHIVLAARLAGRLTFTSTW